MKKNTTLKTRDFLQIFYLIEKKGIKTDGVSEFLGLRAWHDFDGYTCWLSYKDLTITLLFHGKLGLDYTNKETFDDFHKKVNSLIVLN